ncbi:hypothetical protein AA13595_1664 [Gluconacetobacter johannae DSM 13595]|nr:hypothetical protein AA13595_1664 [Gluconacetobacter johannae DSM 13595]
MCDTCGPTIKKGGPMGTAFLSFSAYRPKNGSEIVVPAAAPVTAEAAIAAAGVESGVDVRPRAAERIS